jgi:thiamine-phosphate pyrophosphorylase
MTGAQPVVYLVTDRRRLAPDARTDAAAIATLERWLDEAIQADVDVVQIRERDLDARSLHALATRLVARTAGRATRVVVNERADVALVAGADGVHLRSGSLPAARLRAIAPEGWIIGRSTHGATACAGAAGVDYVLFGTVFPSASKPAGAATQGTEGLADAVRRCAVPLIAIGGMTPERAEACAAAGASGVAAIGVFLPEGRASGALGPARAVAALRSALSAGARRRPESSLPFPATAC